MREARIVRRTLVIAGTAAAMLGLGANAAYADDWGQYVPGKHVYDVAGVLTPDQVAKLEKSAAALDQKGNSAVVYSAARPVTISRRRRPPTPC
jgi:uncharacterized membrane protein YgcG